MIFCWGKKIVLRRKSAGHLPKTNTIIFIIISAVNRSKLYLRNTINGESSVFAYGFYSSTNLDS